MRSQLISVLARGGLQPFRGVVQLAAQPSTGSEADWANARPYSEVPGPKPLPVIGNAWRFMPGIGTLPVHDFSLWIKQMYETYGPVSKVTNIPGRHDMVFLFDPRDFETMLRHEGQWPVRPMIESLAYYRSVTRKDFFQGVGGILTVNGEPWQKFRTFVNPAMMQPRNARNYAERIDGVTSDFMDLIPGMLDENQETPAHFVKEIQKWALESISLVALDARIGCLKPNLKADSEPHKMIQAADEFFELIFKLDFGFPLWKFVSTPSWRRYVKVLDYITEVCLKHISKAQAKIESGASNSNSDVGVLEHLLRRNPDPKMAVVMAMDMMLAGIDTTSYTAAGVLYHLARNPEQQERLYQELRRELPEGRSPITAAILENLKYLKACVKENNRINPIAIGMGRRIPEDIVVSNYKIPKGTELFLCNMMVTNMESQFPEPKRFLPERWLKDAGCPVSEHKAHPFAMMPFGFGKRNCVGMRFATLEIETLVAKVVRNYRMEWHHGEMTFKSGAVYAPADPVRIKMVAR